MATKVSSQMQGDQEILVCPVDIGAYFSTNNPKVHIVDNISYNEGTFILQARCGLATIIEKSCPRSTFIKSDICPNCRTN